MKVLIVLSHSGFFRHFDTVVTHLCNEGHDVKLITRSGAKHDIDKDYQREMLSTLGDHPRGSYDLTLRKPSGLISWRVRRLRGVLDYGHYYRFQHNSSQLAPRMARLCPRRIRPFFATRIGRRVVSSDSFMAAYRRFQAHLPADRGMLKQVRDEAPDVVVASPYIYRLSGDVEYARAAQKLGIPTVGVVASWDNLSTKGTFPLLPDSVIVWNEGLAKEARTIHALPRDRMMVTGAAKFDHYFELRPTETRAEFCERVGLDLARPYVLYIGSSQQVAGDETGFVSELEAALQADPRTTGTQVVVRPHPLNGEVWQAFEHDRILVHPRGGERPDIAGPRDDYFHTLKYASAVVGVNTSAFLEAAIADRPCLSIVSDRHREGQVERGHFQHLLKGRFIETVPDFDGAVEALAEILEGRDHRGGLRRRFVESFVRPAGLSRRAGESVAEAIVATAERGVREPEPVLPWKIAAQPKPPRRGVRTGPPSEHDERRAMMRIHDGHPVGVRQPLVLISQLGDQGGDLLNRLLDGHPQLHGHPHRLAIGQPRPEVWPQLDLAAGAESWFEALREPLPPLPGNGRDAPDPSAATPFLMVPSLQRVMFHRCVEEWEPTTRRAVLDCHVTSYFNAWLDYQNLYGEEQRWVAAFGDALGLGEANQRTFFDDYSDGRLVVVVGGPTEDGADGWAQAAESVLAASRSHGDRLTVIDLRNLDRDLEGTMRELAGVLEIEFDPILMRPTINGLAAPGAVSPVSADREPTAVEPRAGELYEQLLSAAAR
jgi:hypothetical protein